MRLALALTLTAAPALADGVAISTSQVWTVPSEHGGWLDVWFKDQMTNGPYNTGLGFNLGSGITFDFQHSEGTRADIVTVHPPEGYFCHPSCEIKPGEHDSGFITLYSIESVGM